MSSGLAQEVPPGFVAETVVDGINAATALTIAPDGRVFIAEQTGTVRVWKGDRLLPTPALELGGRLDTYWERGLIGLTLHPDFPHTPYAFAVYVAKAPVTHHVVSRFTVVGDTLDVASERILLEGDDQARLGGTVPAGHQGGPVRVGLDDKLYVGLGEQTAGKPSQALDSLLGKILRINLDGSIPTDNPYFAQTTSKYRAIWATGIRNPFGLAFEPGTGRLWETDVGQTSFEEINVISKGGNYGWPEAEGLSTNTAFVNPVHTYPPAIGRSIVGGMFYPSAVGRSSRRAEASEPAIDQSSAGASPYQFPVKWRGKFFFADWANHWIKALDPNQPDDVATFARNLNGPVALEPAPDGSLFVLNRGTIWRDPEKFVERSGSLVRIRYVGPHTQMIAAAQPSIPRTLEATALFTSLKPIIPAVRFEEFQINLPPWQPGVRARRWISLPAGEKIQFSTDGEWGFPTNAVVIQHFELSDGPLAGQPFETHVLWFTGPRVVRAGAYRWNAEGSGAELIEDAEITPLPGQPSRNWFSPGAELALNLDTVVTGFLLPLNTRQLNRLDPTERLGNGRPPNQLEEWNRRGWFNPSLAPGELDSLPRLADLSDLQAPLELRVRSYLDVNCAACHRPGGLSRGQFDARFSTPLTDQRLIGGGLIAGDLGISGAKVVVPGEPAKSVLLERVRRNDTFRMPQVNVNEEPQPIGPALEEWISNMPAVPPHR